MTTWDMLLRLGAGVGLGAVICVDRQYRARMAGLRTNALVAVGATFDENTAPATVSTDAAELPYYAGRSLLRMFLALGLSMVFTFVFATAAARLRRAGTVLLSILDILSASRPAWRCADT
jgi:hypothetical protein